MKKKLIVVLLVLFVGGYGFAYYNNSKTSSKIKTDILGAKAVNSSGDLNYSFNLEGNLNVRRDGKVFQDIKLNATNGGIISLDNALKQRIVLGSLSVSSTGSYKNNFLLSDLDIVSDNSKLYAYIGEGKDSIFENFNGKDELISNISSILGEKSYVMFDNSKPILNTLGDLSKDELIKNLAVSLSTSNPSEYLKKLGADKELKDFLSSDKLINLMFKDGVVTQNGSKVNLLLNEKNCKTLSPILINLSKELKVNLFKETSIPSLEPSLDTMIKNCETGISKTNSILPIIAKIYKEGDIKAGNFKFSLSQGSLAELNIEYKNHIVEKWSIDSSFKDKFIFTANGDKDKITSSLLKLNINESGTKIIGEVKDGKGKININLDIKGFKVSGFIDFNAYLPSEIDISGKGESFSSKVDFSLKGNYDSGKLYYSSFNKYKPSYKSTLNFDYGNNLLSIEFSKKDTAEKTIEGKLVYKDNKVEGNFKGLGNSLNLNGFINSIKDFELKLDSNTGNLVLIGKEVSNNEVSYNVTFNEGERGITKNKINFNLDIKSSQKDGFEIKDLVGKLDIPNEKTTVDFNLKYSYKNSGVEYKIPINFKEIDVKLNEMFTLPNMNLKISKVDRKQAIIVGGIVGGILGVGANKVYTQQLSKAKDSARIMNIKQIQTGIEMYYSDNNKLPSRLNLRKELSQYLPNFPVDPLENTYKNGCKFMYFYEIVNEKKGKYKVSTCLENDDTKMAKNDGGVYDNRYEVGNFDETIYPNESLEE